MPNSCNNLGRAFEYACLLELQLAISEYRTVEIDEQNTRSALIAWNSISSVQRENLRIAAMAFIHTLFEAEPNILECDGCNDILIISMNNDHDAELGDVRDIVIKRELIAWEIGFSMKHNHFAIRHSRLSDSNDFGSKWYGIPCSEIYWDAVQPIFERLKNLKEQQLTWRAIANKSTTVYFPLLDAFKDEMERQYSINHNIVASFMSYLLGIKDFYKVIAIDRKKLTEVQCFNLRGELNRDGKMVQANIFVPLAELPNEIILLRFKPASLNTLEMYLNNGWTLSFRIHNASTFVEPSLKFDIKFLGIPSNIITINCLWSVDR